MKTYTFTLKKPILLVGRDDKAHGRALLESKLGIEHVVVLHAGQSIVINTHEDCMRVDCTLTDTKERSDAKLDG